MIPEKIKEVLKANWGEKADALNCYAEIKFIDPLSSPWACYIFAMDESEEIVHCLFSIAHRGSEIISLNLQDIYNSYNGEGEHPIIDEEFRRMRVTELLKRLNHDS